MGCFLERALVAEEELEAARRRIADLESRIQGVLNHEPESASRALSWIGRAEQAEKLLVEMAKWIKANPSVRELLPTGLPQRIDAQLHTIVILKRDHEAMGEKPATPEWWTGYLDESGRPLLRAGDDGRS